MKDIELQTEAFKRYIQECDEQSITPDYAGAFNAAWNASAAVEADRAQRVPVVSVRDAVTKNGPLWEKFCAVYETYCGRQITIKEIAWRCFLAASTPAQPAQQEPPPIDMVLHCPSCGMQHIDGPDDRKHRWRVGDRALTPYGIGTISRLSCGTGFTEAFFADLELPAGRFAVNERELRWPNEPHRSHLCHGCSHIWRPADVPTNGVQAVKTKGKADSPEPPQPVERKPMTDEVVREGFAACGVGGINARLGFVEGVKFTERHHGIRE